jgi:enoyl-CoA hydratase/carnithine racemase
MDVHDDIKSSLAEGVLTITLARPHRRNALTMAMFSRMASALREADRDPQVLAVLILGEGASFCAGHDRDAFADWPQGAGDPVPSLMHALVDFGKPLVMGVQGTAAGLGATMLLHADWVISARDAGLRFPFIDLGFVPEAASTLLLVEAAGALRAKRLLLSGDTLGAADAFDWGLVSELAEPHEVSRSALERAATLARKDGPTYRGIKSLVGDRLALHARVDLEIELIGRSLVARRDAAGKGLNGQ